MQAIKAAEAATLYDIELRRITESATNPRKLFDPKALAELAESIKKNGLVHAVLLRPIKGGKADFELVVGARRLRASNIAEAKMIRAEVRELTDEQVIEIQTIENLHRQDIHPLEEADGYRLLMAAPFNKTAEQIATQIGKSKGYIYAALKLLALGEKARKAFFGGKVDKSVAILLARIPNLPLQEKALAEVSREDSYSGSAFSFKKAAAHIQQHYMLRLADAPFDIKDAKLIEKAGACGPCSKRTGNQKELFGDVESADMCTDPACYAEKRDANSALLLASAEKGGQRVLDEKASKKIFPFQSDELGYDAPYSPLGKKCFEDPKGRTYGQILKKAGVEDKAVAVVAPSGKLVELAPKAANEGAKKALGIRASYSSGGGQSAAAEKKRRQEQVRQRAITRAVIAAVVAAAKPGADFFRIIVRCLARHSWADTLKEVENRRGLSSKGSGKRGSALVKMMESLELRDLGPLMLEIAITQGAYFSYRGGMGEGVKEAARIFKVDVKKIERQIAAEMAEKRKAPKKKGGGK